MTIEEGKKKKEIQDGRNRTMNNRNHIDAIS
jgi:hypothetical protein